MSHFFSIILPTYNRASLLAVAVESVLAQHYEKWELIIINDGSTDNTKDYLASLRDHRIKVFDCENKGQARATNFGLNLATGDYICFLDDDDYYDEIHLSTFEKHISDSPVILRTAFKRVTPKGKVKKGILYKEVWHGNTVQFAMEHMCSVCTLAIPRDFVKALRFVDRKNWLDTHFILRLFAQHPIRQIDAYTYNYRIHQVMGSQKNLQSEKLEAKAEDNVSIIKEFFEQHPEIKQKYLAKNTVKKVIAKKYAEYATTALRQNHNRLAQEFMQKSYQEIWHHSLWKNYLIYYLVKMGLR